MHYLQQALNLAASRQGFCAPNPAVGAVIVKNNQIIATGYHYGPGYPHAEVDALNKIDETASRGATLYVTLEPCRIWGRTPPCTDLLISRGIVQVIYGIKDPNPQVAGQGIAQLEQAGIQCVQEPSLEVEEFYRAYKHWWHTGMPFVTAKLALSLDGKIAGKDGPVAITGKKLAQFTHQQRMQADAILTTARTIICDDPLLNVRLTQETIAKPLYILDTHLATSNNAKIWQSAKTLTFFHADTVSQEQISAKQSRGARCIAVPLTNNHCLDWQALLQQIGSDGFHAVWMEAGGQAFESLLQTDYCQQVYLYIAAKVLGEAALTGLRHANVLERFQNIHWQVCDKDVICQLNIDALNSSF
jgi:diaminohydroxyphosphoribosylaminopyrimidine deaminase/5-amino-6-(5-phosphoribosylamino)uracil reductase